MKILNLRKVLARYVWEEYIFKSDKHQFALNNTGINVLKHPSHEHYKLLNVLHNSLWFNYHKDSKVFTYKEV